MSSDSTTEFSSRGRFWTALTGAAVLAITASAILFDGGMRDNRILRIAIPDTAYYVQVAEPAGVLCDVLSQVTGRDVEVVRAAGNWPDDCELYVMPAGPFARRRGELGLEALYECSHSARRDAAVIIAAADEPAPAFDGLSYDDIIFGSSHSPNACWRQLQALDGAGVALPARLDSLHFAGGPAGVRVVFSVLFDRFRVGACRESDIEALVATNRVSESEISVLRRLPGLPEIVVAARGKDIRYFEKHLGRLRTALLDPARDDRGVVDRLVSHGIRGIAPVTDHEVAEIDSLAAYVAKRFSARVD